MNIYSRGKIYILRSNQTEDIYVGSTTQPLYRRFSEHKKRYRYYINNNTSYTSSFDIMQYEDAYIDLYEDYKCNTRKELQRREGEIIRLLNCVNRRIEGRTNQERYQDNIAFNREYEKKYREEHKQEISEKRKIKILCECGHTVTKTNLSRHKNSNKHLSSIAFTTTTRSTEPIT